MENEEIKQDKVKIEEKENTKLSIPKIVGICLLIFLGGFCAFYVLIDWHLKTLFMPQYPTYFNNINSQIERDFNKINKEINEQEKSFQKHNGKVIFIEQNEDEYKITIDLKKFDNNEQNLNIKVLGNMLSINGRTIKKSNHHEQISEFQQSYLFGSEVKLEELTKNRVGNSYIITIPINKN